VGQEESFDRTVKHDYFDAGVGFDSRHNLFQLWNVCRPEYVQRRKIDGNSPVGVRMFRLTGQSLPIPMRLRGE